MTNKETKDKDKFNNDNEIGDKIKVTTIDQEISGTLIPSSKKEITIVKLENGYNVGIKKKEIKEIKVIERKKEIQAPKNKPLLPDKSLPTIKILHTGGTIASKVDYRTGGVTADFSPEELVNLFPELKQIANIESELISQMWSDDLRFAHFSLIAEKIKESIEKEEVKKDNNTTGIIIGIGTDNLAVAAAALSFIVEKTPIPIIFVGAQRSSDRGSSDAAVNLIAAANFITKTDFNKVNFNGVGICMHGSSSDKFCSILPANKTYKFHSSRRDAFKAVNSEAIARVGFDGKVVILDNEKIDSDNNNKQTKKSKPHSKLVIRPKMEEKVGLLKIHVNMFPEQFSFFADNKFKGLIIEGTGLGHTPGQAPNELCEIHEKMYPAIKKIIDSGCVVVMTTQCIFGGVNMNVYDKGRDLLELGVISGKDMLANTALVKLSWLLANHNKDEAIKLIRENLRGEINEKISYQEDFLDEK